MTRDELRAELVAVADFLDAWDLPAPAETTYAHHLRSLRWDNARDAVAVAKKFRAEFGDPRVDDLGDTTVTLRWAVNPRFRLAVVALREHVLRPETATRTVTSWVLNLGDDE